MPVHFVNVTWNSGLPTGPVGAARAQVAQQKTRKKRTQPHRKRARSRGEPHPHPSLSAKFLGSGACIIDYDGNGRPDIFLVDADGDGNSALYRNEGNGKFTNVTKEAKLEIHGQGMGCAVGDYDNDGRPDLAVSMNGGVLLFHNEGKGSF